MELKEIKIAYDKVNKGLNSPNIEEFIRLNPDCFLTTSARSDKAVISLKSYYDISGEYDIRDIADSIAYFSYSYVKEDVLEETEDYKVVRYLEFTQKMSDDEVSFLGAMGKLQEEYNTERYIKC
jgi:hypothetical protein